MYYAHKIRIDPLNHGGVDLTGVLSTDLRPKYHPEFVNSNSTARKREIGFWKNRKRVVPSRSLGGHMKVCKCLWQEIWCATVIFLRTAGDSMCRHIYTCIWNIIDYDIQQQIFMQKIKHDILLQFVSYRYPPPQYVWCSCSVISQCYADTVPFWYTKIIFIKFCLGSAKEYELYWIYVWWLISAISFCRWKINIIFVFSPRNNELTIKLREITK